ncbi:MAG: phosphatidylserine decarboxylase, partial [Syntrophaceae bacterium]|nr:phosphatidylserine decarboxylase [Syntrophaceae bacterium]
MQHNYIERDTRQIKTEQFYGDQVVQFLYSQVREQSSWLFRRLISARISSVLGYMNYDGILSTRMKNYLDIHKQLNIDPAECL